MRVLTVLLLALAPLLAFADSWGMPKKWTTTSADGRWALTVIPKSLSSQLDYFRDKVDEKDDAGAAPGVAENHARARLQKDGVEIADWRLVNEVSPVSALVANDGTVVTFDNWHSMGYGEDVVVLYRSDGTLIAKHGLESFLRKEDIERLSHSVSSIWWSGTHRIDEEKRQLILEIVHDEKVIHEVSIPLDDGKAPPVVPKLFPPPRVSLTTAASEVARCAGMLVLTGEELLARATSAAPPDYPILGQKARIAGTVILDLIVAENGTVESVVMVKPLPFGLDKAAETAAKEWRFQPASQDGKAIRMCGRVAVKYELF